MNLLESFGAEVALAFNLSIKSTCKFKPLGEIKINPKLINIKL
jgi:hypothetical protein